MKRGYLLFGLLVWYGGLLCAQQEWAPFPYQQRTFWHTGAEGELFYNDLRREGAGGQPDTLLFGAEYRYGAAGEPCFDSLVSYYFSLNPAHSDYQARETPLPDTLFQDGDVWFAQSGGSILPFYPSAPEGFSWTVLLPPASGYDSIRWSCVEVYEAEVMGQPTLLKCYAGVRYSSFLGGLDTLETLLSRDFGLVRYVPFREWHALAPTSRQLLGWADMQDAHGFTNSFEDYFGSIKPGSVFKYQLDTARFSRQIIQRDSVLSVSLDAGSATVWYARSFRATVFGPFVNGSYLIDTVFYGSYSFQRQIPRNRYEETLAQTPGWFFYHPASSQTHLRDHTVLDPLSLDPFGRITLYARFGEYVLPELDCHPGVADLCNFYYRLTTGVGLSYEQLSCMGDGWTRQLIGYQIGDETWGDAAPIEIASSIRSGGGGEPLRLYPNPGREALHVDYPAHWPEGGALIIRLYDLAGRLVLEQLHKREQAISTLGLPPGLYFVHLHQGAYFAQGKWVKQ